MAEAVNNASPSEYRGSIPQAVASVKPGERARHHTRIYFLQSVGPLVKVAGLYVGGLQSLQLVEQIGVTHFVETAFKQSDFLTMRAGLHLIVSRPFFPVSAYFKIALSLRDC